MPSNPDEYDLKKHRKIRRQANRLNRRKLRKEVRRKRRQSIKDFIETSLNVSTIIIIKK